MKSAYQTIDEYIAGTSERAQPVLRRMCEVIRENAPEAPEKISWSMPGRSGFLAHRHPVEDFVHSLIPVYPAASAPMSARWATSGLRQEILSGALGAPTARPASAAVPPQSSSMARSAGASLDIITRPIVKRRKIAAEEIQESE